MTFYSDAQRGSLAAGRGKKQSCEAGSQAPDENEALVSKGAVVFRLDRREQALNLPGEEK